MRAIRSVDTKPELAVRKVVTAMGFHYRLHATDLPGRPDIVFRKRRKAIFINGCFWHFHKKCGTAHFPESRIEYWIPKLERNRRRDRRNVARLRGSGWSVLTIWECEVRDAKILEDRVRLFMAEGMGVLKTKSNLLKAI